MSHFFSSIVWDGRRFAQTDAQKDYDNVVDLRDSVLHAELRKSWNQAFSSEPLKDYELLLMPRIEQLLEIFKGACLCDQDGIGRVNIAKWIGCFAYVVQAISSSNLPWWITDTVPIIFLRFDFIGDVASVISILHYFYSDTFKQFRWRLWTYERRR